MEPVQLNVGFEESRETLKKFRGERWRWFSVPGVSGIYGRDCFSFF
jgi:hypothetical protein